MSYDTEKEAKELSDRLRMPEAKERIKCELQLAYNYGGRDALQSQIDALKVVTG